MYLAIVIYWFEIHYILFVHLSQYVCKCNCTAALQFKPHSLCILCGLAMFYYTLWLFLTLYLIYNICLAEIIKGCICQTHTFCTLAFLTFFFFITSLARQKLVAPTVKLDELESGRVHLKAKAVVSLLHEQTKMGTIVREPLSIK